MLTSTEQQETFPGMEGDRTGLRQRLADAGIEVATGVGGNPLRAVKPRPKLVAMLLRWLTPSV